MRYSVASRLTALVMVAGAVFGVAAPAFAAPAAPGNLVIFPGQYTNDTTPTFVWTRTGGATWYEYLLDDGNWKGIGNVGKFTSNELSNGWHTFYVRAHDNEGGVSVSSAVTFEIDTQGPAVPAVTPSTAKTGEYTKFNVVPSGESRTTSCDLYINGVNQGIMYGDVGGSFSSKFVFSAAGTYTVAAKCVDGDHNTSMGASRAVTVTRGTTTVVNGVTLTAGMVVKPMCQNYEPKSGTCHSVYYVGTDGMLHGFPSESVYKSWYSSFSNVVEIETWKFNSQTVGKDVTFRPGTSLVKFASSTTVYAVDVNQTLRPIMNEAAAKAIYGTRWNSYVVTIPASQRNDYKIGSKIYSSADYSKSRAYNAVKTIDSLWTVIAYM